MRPFLIFVLTSYVVRCDENYYVIEIPEEPIERISDNRRPFKVYWNVPTKQCTSKKVPFTNLDRFGIIQNTGDSFRGDKIAILYDPGLFPALLKNETSGKYKFRNGGVPQEGDLDKHIEAFKDILETSVPNLDFNGVGIIDFESWRPVFRQNFGVLVPYKDVSVEIERKLHWWWPKKWLQEEAKRRFEEAGRTFMQTTIAIAKQMRPMALWGYYGFPYCFNMASNNMVESCSDAVKKENDGLYWLWSESTALYPSVYSSVSLTTSQLGSLIRGRVSEAIRVRSRNSPVLPYFWFRYRDAGFLTKKDLDMALKTMRNSGADGFIIWGSSKDVNTVEKCTELRTYIETVMGPAIAQYATNDTKRENDGLSEYNHNNTASNENDDTKNKTVMEPDPEYHWAPPENYTQNIEQHVKELIKNSRPNNTDDESETSNNLERNALLDIVLHLIMNEKQNITEIFEGLSENSTAKSSKKDVTTEMYSKTEDNYSTIITSRTKHYTESTSQQYTDSTTEQYTQSTTEQYTESTTQQYTESTTEQYTTSTTEIVGTTGTDFDVSTLTTPNQEASSTTETSDSDTEIITIAPIYTTTESTTPMYSTTYETPTEITSTEITSTTGYVIENNKDTSKSILDVNMTEVLLENKISKNEKKGKPIKMNQENTTEFEDVDEASDLKNKKKGIPKRRELEEVTTSDAPFVHQVSSSAASDLLSVQLLILGLMDCLYLFLVIAHL